MIVMVGMEIVLYFYLECQKVCSGSFIPCGRKGFFRIITEMSRISISFS